MSGHIVKSFGEELDALSNEIARMGGLAETMTADAIQAMARRDPDLAARIVARDKQLDAAQAELERKAILMFALRQPVAADLRVTFAALKISAELERIGDLAKNIAKRSLVLDAVSPGLVTRGAEAMGRTVLAQLAMVLDAYATQDVSKAITVWSRDEDVDEQYNSLFRELLTYMMEDPRTISAAAHLLFIAKNLERIGDHATNIAELVHFIVTGEQLPTDRPKSNTVLPGPAPAADNGEDAPEDGAA